MVGGYAAGCGTQRCESRKRRCGFFSTNARERGLCFVRVQCERMAVLGPVVSNEALFEVTSFPLYNRARAATPACTHVGSPLSLSKSMYAPQAPKLSPKRKHAKRPTTSQPAPISLIPCHTHTPQKQPTQLRPATNHTPLSLISRVQRLLAPRLSQMAQQMFIIEGSSGLFSLLFLSLIVTHSLHTAHTWLVGIKTLFSSGA